MPVLWYFLQYISSDLTPSSSPFQVQSSTVLQHVCACAFAWMLKTADLPYMRAEDQKLNYSSGWSYVMLFHPEDPFNMASS